MGNQVHARDPTIVGMVKIAYENKGIDEMIPYMTRSSFKSQSHKSTKSENSS